MNIRTTQLKIFGDPYPDELGGGNDLQYGGFAPAPSGTRQIPRFLQKWQRQRCVRALRQEVPAWR